MTSIISDKVLCAAIATHFSSRGYFVRRNYEIPDIMTVDLVCIMPRVSDLAKRTKSKCFVPSGILYTLIDQGWKTTEEIALETNSTDKFVSSAFDEICEDKWVEKKEENNKVLWTLKDYRIPSKDCVIVHCRSRESKKFLEKLSDLDGCYNKLYFAFPYPIDEEFIDFCHEKGIGILIFYEKVGFFKELLPPEIKAVTNLKAYANICEVIIKENLLYKSIDSI